MSELKFCKDCANFLPSDSDKCTAPENWSPYFNLVTGEKLRIKEYASNARASEQACGLRATWFKPKEGA